MGGELEISVRGDGRGSLPERSTASGAPKKTRTSVRVGNAGGRNPF